MGVCKVEGCDRVTVARGMCRRHYDNEYQRNRRSLRRPAPVKVPVIRVERVPGVRQDTSWMDEALCAETDPEMFFPEAGGSTLPAKRVCARCDVAAQCLAYAIGQGFRDGVWGGQAMRRFKEEVA